MVGVTPIEQTRVSERLKHLAEVTRREGQAVSYQDRGQVGFNSHINSDRCLVVSGALHRKDSELLSE